MLTYFSNYWTFCLVMTVVQIFFKSHYDVNHHSFSLVPVIIAVVMPLTGVLADVLRCRQALGTTRVRRILNSLGLGGQVVCLLVMAFSRHRQLSFPAVFVLAAANAVSQAGFQVNLLDIAPRYAGILGGICNGVGSFAGNFLSQSMLRRNKINFT